MRGILPPRAEDPTGISADRLGCIHTQNSRAVTIVLGIDHGRSEEACGSEPLPGRVMDVRVGDPHNDGKTGILVLTSENEERNRRLLFFGVSGTG